MVHADCSTAPELTHYNKLVEELPPDAKRFILRIAGCRMWTRPQRLPEMQKQKNEALAGLRCDHLRSDGAALERTYSSRDDVRRALDEAYRERLGWAESDDF